MIEDLDKLVEARLLWQEVCRGWLGGFFLQSEVHAFVTAILLGVTRLDTLDADAEAKPPDRQLAQVESSVRRSEGHAVVAANVGGQAALLKKPLKYRKSVSFSRGRKSLAGQQKNDWRDQ